jgi:hypothetical protein
LLRFLHDMAESTTTVDEIVAAFEQAAEVQRAHPLRRGSTVRIGPDDADDVFVSADLHGHRQNFDAILAAADLDHQPRRHLVLQEVCHGGPTYDDGGCKSHLMLEDVARLVVKYAGRVHFLLSNHELAEVIDYPIMKARRMLNVIFRMGLVDAYGADADKVRQAAVGFIRECPLAIAIGDDVFVTHSLPERLDMEPFDAEIFDRPLRPSDLLEGGTAFQIVWGRDFRPDNAAEYAKAVGAKVLLHGHEPCQEGYRTPNERQIILDCCGSTAYSVLVPTRGPVTQESLLKSLVKIA